MKLIVWELALLLFILCAATSLILLNSSLSSYRSVLRSSSGHLLVFSVFNGVIFAILATNYRTSTDECDGFLPTLQFVYGGEEGEEIKETTHSTYIDNSRSDSRDDSDDYDKDDDDDENINDDDDYYYSSAGYDEDDDDDDDGSDEEVGWEEDDDDDEYYDDLETRSEEFIAKVKKGWKEEILMDNLEKKYVD